MEQEIVKYDAFISYRHSELDRYVAMTIQKRLEGFRLPKNFSKKREGGRNVISRIFRDQDELSLADNLAEPLALALENSDFLIVISTPRYPQSSWCLQEIENFLKNHDMDHVLVVLAEGEPDESFPEILTYRDVEITDDNGNVRIERKSMEPLAADVRGADKREINKKMDDAVLRIAAAMFGVSFDSLKQRHREQRMRRMIAFFGSVAAVLLIFSIVCFALLTKINDQKSIISEQYRDIQLRYANSMVNASQQLMSAGRRKDAVYLVNKVLPDNPVDETLPYSAEAERALASALELYDRRNGFSVKGSVDAESGVTELTASASGRYLAFASQDGNIVIYDMIAEKEVGRTGLSDSYTQLIYLSFMGEDKLFFFENGEVHRYDILSGRDELLYRGENSSVYLSEEGKVFAVWEDNILRIFDLNNKEIFSGDFTEQLAEYAGRELEIAAASCSHSGKTLTLALSPYGGGASVLISVDLINSEEVFFDIYTINANVCIANSDDMIYFVVYNGYTPDTMFANVYGISFATGQPLWASSVYNDVFTRIDYIEDAGREYVVTAGDKRVSLYTADDGQRLCDELTSELIISMNRTQAGDAVMFSLKNGGVLKLDASAVIVDYSLNNFNYSMSNVLDYCRVYDNCVVAHILYSDYVYYMTRYDTPGYKLLPDMSDNSHSYPYRDNSELIKELGIDGSNISASLESEDGKLFITELSNGELSVYSIEGKRLLNTIYGSYSLMRRLIYCSEIDKYLLIKSKSSLLLNSDGEVVAELQDVYDYCVNGVPGFVMKEVQTGEESSFYFAPYVTYEQLIAAAKSYLGDYEPSQKIRKRYGI